MKRKAIFLISIFMIGCTQSPISAPVQDGSQPITPSESVQINEGGMGGNLGYTDWEYNFIYYGVESRFEDLVESEAFDEWLVSCESSPGHTRAEDYNMLAFIQKFNISKENVIAKNKSLKGYEVFTDEQINALYSNDKGLLADAFMNPNAVRVGDEIYPPKWVATHTLDELKAAGITESILEAKCSEWKETFGESSDVYTGAKALLDQYQAEIEPTE